MARQQLRGYPWNRQEFRLGGGCSKSGAFGILIIVHEGRTTKAVILKSTHFPSEKVGTLALACAGGWKSCQMESNVYLPGNCRPLEAKTGPNMQEEHSRKRRYFSQVSKVPVFIHALLSVFVNQQHKLGVKGAVLCTAAGSSRFLDSAFLTITQELEA